jgi:HAE1 family hydrophobic/amphiphilic exporter-1
MTGVSMIFGVLPAAMGIGPGSETRQPMAIATACGMFSSMMLTLLVVPVFYVFLDDAVAWLTRNVRRLLRRPSEADDGLRPPPAGTVPTTPPARRQTTS